METDRSQTHSDSEDLESDSTADSENLRREWMIIDGIASIFSKDAQTPLIHQASLALIAACREQSTDHCIPQRITMLKIVEAITTMFDKHSPDQGNTQLNAWMMVATMLCELSQKEDMNEHVCHALLAFASRGVLHQDMIRPLAQLCMEADIASGDRRRAMVALILLAKEGFSDDIMVSSALSYLQKIKPVVACEHVLRLIQELPEELLQPRIAEIARACARKARAQSSEKSIPLFILITNIVSMSQATRRKVLDAEVLHALVVAVSLNCEEARICCRELILCGCSTPAFLAELSQEEGGKSILMKCAGDSRVGSCGEMAALRQCVCILPIAMRLMLNEHLHCRLLHSIYERLELPSEAWRKVVDCIGLFHPSFARLTISASHECSGSAHCKSPRAGVSSAEQDYSSALDIPMLACSDPLQEAEEGGALVFPEEAAAIAHEQWASAVDMRIATETSASHAFMVEETTTDSTTLDPKSHAEAPRGDQEVSSSPEAIHIIQYSKHPREFMDALLNGNALRRCREALESDGHQCQLPSGCKVFVHPDQYRCVMRELDGRELRPYHVVVAQSLEHLVEESLAQLPYNKRPRVKSSSSIEFTSFALLEEGEDGIPQSQDVCNDTIDRELLLYWLPCRRAGSVVHSAPAGTTRINPRQANHPERIDYIVENG